MSRALTVISIRPHTDDGTAGDMAAPVCGAPSGQGEEHGDPRGPWDLGASLDGGRPSEAQCSGAGVPWRVGGHWGESGEGIDRRPRSEREGTTKWNVNCFSTTRSHGRNSGGRWSCVSGPINLSPIPRECESSECLRSRLAGSDYRWARLRLFRMPLTTLVLVNRQTSTAPHLDSCSGLEDGHRRGGVSGAGTVHPSWYF